MRRFYAFISIVLLFSSVVWGAKLVPNGASSQTITVVIKDATGVPATGVTIANLDLFCIKDGDQMSAKTDLSAGASDHAAWVTGTAYELGLGAYRVDIPDVNLSDGAGVMLTYVIDDTVGTNQTVFYEVQLSAPVGNVTLANGAHGGAAATLTLSSAAITNASGAALTLSGTTAGLSSTASAGPGASLSGTTYGLYGSASAGPGIGGSGTTYGVYGTASAGPGMGISGTTRGLSAIASAGPGIYASGTTYGMHSTASAGDGIYAASTGSNGNGMNLAPNGSGKSLALTSYTDFAGGGGGDATLANQTLIINMLQSLQVFP